MMKYVPNDIQLKALLYRANKTGDYQDFERAIQKGLDIHEHFIVSGVYYMTALAVACVYDDYNLVKFLIGKGAKVDDYVVEYGVRKPLYNFVRIYISNDIKQLLKGSIMDGSVFI